MPSPIFDIQSGHSNPGAGAKRPSHSSHGPAAQPQPATEWSKGSGSHPGSHGSGFWARASASHGRSTKNLAARTHFPENAAGNFCHQNGRRFLQLAQMATPWPGHGCANDMSTPPATFLISSGSMIYFSYILHQNTIGLARARPLALKSNSCLKNSKGFWSLPG